MNRVSDQLSDRLIFGRLFQANEKFSTFDGQRTTPLVFLYKQLSEPNNCGFGRMSAMNRVSDQLSDRLIFGRLFQANEKFSTFRSCANL